MSLHIPSPRTTWQLMKASFSSWSDDYAPSMGAALAYYTLFSIAPLLLIVITVAGFFFGADAVRGAVFGQVSGLMGDEGARAIQDMLASVSEPKNGTLSSIIGVCALLLGASTVFGELQNGMDRIWRAPLRDKPSGIWGMLRTRLLSFGMVLGLAFLLAVSLVVSAALAALGKWWGPMFGGWEILAHALDLVVSFGLLTVIFAVIYKVMPRVPVGWHDVWIGGGVTALLFTIGKFAIGLYLGKSDVASGFGAAGSLVIVILWVYYSAQIFYLGAEFTRVYADTLGSRKDQPKAESAAASSEAPNKAEAAGTGPRTRTREAANGLLDRPALTPVQQVIARKRAITGAENAGDGVTIRSGRMMVHPREHGLEHRALAAAKRSRSPRRASSLTLGVAAAVGLVVGAIARAKRASRSPWMNA